MSVAVKVIDACIREDFGFKHLLWVFSGRRGVHCWVSDAKARKLNNEARTAIANYLSVHVGNEMTSATAMVEIPTHPALARAERIINKTFVNVMMKEQNILADEKQRNKLMNMLPAGEIKTLVERNWEDHTDYDNPENSVTLWKIFTLAVRSEKKIKFRVDYITSAMFTFLYPRIDANVSKGINHLLKSPFCVHPKTGKICVPFDPEKVDEFDPCTCPTLNQALNEYDELAKAKTSKTKTVPCLESSIQVFNDFLKSLRDEYTQVVSKEKRQIKSKQVNMDVETAF